MKGKHLTAKQKNRKAIGVIVIIAIAVATIISIAFFTMRSNDLIGIWEYDEYTHYEFENNNIGCMCLEEYHYKYSYVISDDQLILNFEDEALHDSTYTYKIQGKILTLVGGEGTVGGTYELKRVEE